jgi:hypothetical protein
MSADNGSTKITGVWRYMIFSNKKNAFRKAMLKDETELKRQIEISKVAILSAQNQFEQVVDPTLIDCYIYELNAAQLRYQFLLRSLKKRELQEVGT